MVGDQHAAAPDAALNETGAEIAEVHLEVCLAFVGEAGAAGGGCQVCGYLGDEHEDLFGFLAPAKVVAA